MARDKPRMPGGVGKNGGEKNTPRGTSENQRSEGSLRRIGSSNFGREPLLDRAFVRFWAHFKMELLRFSVAGSVEVWN